MTERVDAVIVGSGAGGSPVAVELARAGLKVVVLEKGRAIDGQDLVHDEITMCRRDFFVPYPKDEPHTVRDDEKDKARRTSDGWTSNVVGGGTVHYSGFFLRMKPVDFRLRSTLGPVEGATVADWPIAYSDLEPFYARAERAIGVSGAWRRHPFEEPRSADYPLPPLAEHPFARRIDEAAGALGLHPFPTPRAVLSREYDGRSACTPCRMCGSYGCPVGAKGSTAVTLLPAAVATGRCEIRPRSMALEVPVGDDGRARGVVYRDQDTGENKTIEADLVVLACSALETARLLLSSRSGRFPDGLGNGSGLVGKNLVFSGFGKGHGLFRTAGRDWLRDPASSPFVQRSIQDLYLLDQPVDGVRKTGTLLFLLAHANPIASAERVAFRDPDRPLWGAALKQRLREDVADAVTLEFETFCEFLPNPTTYMDLDPEVKDRWGQPVARMTIAKHPLDRAAIRLLVARGRQVLEALGPDEAGYSDAGGETRFLQGGTCRFGDDPAHSVLDPDCRMHEVPNVYVTDGSFLPTSGGVPLTLTILANAFRVAERILARGPGR